MRSKRAGHMPAEKPTSFVIAVEQALGDSRRGLIFRRTFRRYKNRSSIQERSSRRDLRVSFPRRMRGSFSGVLNTSSAARKRKTPSAAYAHNDICFFQA